MNDYSPLITSAHADKPRFVAVVEALTKPLVDIAAVAISLTDAFDLDLAIGAQLDAVGRWAGLSRNFTVPITSAFFSFNVVGLGWNEGSWKGAFVSTVGMTSLDDEAYRAAILARIAKNYWTGTNLEQRTILHADLASFGVDLVPIDNFDMSMDLHVLGSPPPVTMELIRRGYIIPKPCGVRLNIIVGPEVGGGGLFALDDPVAGLDAGAFA